MIKYFGHPKSSALFFWKNTSFETLKKTHFASYFTVSPIELEDIELMKEDKFNFMYPIMIHEPIPVSNIERIIHESRDRGSTVVDCGRASIRNIKMKMRKALADYLNHFISYQLEMEEKKEKMSLEPINDISFNKLKNQLLNMETTDKVSEITQLTGAIRMFIDTGKDMSKINYIASEMEKLRLSDEFDFDRFLHIVKVPGKIAHRITELYIKKFHNILGNNKDAIQECKEDIASLYTLKRLDELRDTIRQHIGSRDIQKAVRTLELIYRIKETNPNFCSGDDLDLFCKALTEEGILYDKLTKMYIDKYLCVIEKRFNEAGMIHREILKVKEVSEKSK